MNQEDIEARKKRLRFLEEAAREKTREAGEAVRRANEYGKRTRELENKQEKTQASDS